MKKKASALTIVLSLLLVTSGINSCIAVVNSEMPVPHFFPDPLTTSMESLNNSTMYAANSEIALQFSVDKDVGSLGPFYALYPSDGWFLYSIDDDQNITANPSIISRDVSTVTSHHGGPTQHETTRYNITIDLHGVSEGQHKIAVFIGVGAFFSEDQLFVPCGYRTFDPLYFVVGGLPSIKVASPDNTVYQTANIPLSFATEHVSQITYSLDGQDNVTIAGNITLTGLPNGDHNVTVFAIDESGNVGSSETVSFRVVVPFPTTLAIASIASVAVMSAGLLVYFKKRKR